MASGWHEATGPDLARSYEACRLIHREHGRSYYRATALLPAARRRAVHALYAFTRLADDIVDDGSPAERAAERLTAWRRALMAVLEGGATTDPVLPAVADTVRAYGLDLQEIDLFLSSMAMDLTVARYRSYHDLLGYMEGSSAVIGTLMLPILGLVPGSNVAVARAAARELGFAFQLTNFIRDVAEDLGRGRVYLPAEDLDLFGVSVEALRRRRPGAGIGSGARPGALRVPAGAGALRRRGRGHRAARAALPDLHPRRIPSLWIDPRRGGPGGVRRPAGAGGGARGPPGPAGLRGPAPADLRRRRRRTRAPDRP
jgi:phytoene/squalene synthetase